jgi:hypothetical protein
MLSVVAAGRIMVGIAVLGLLVSLVGGIVGRQLVADLDDGVGQTLMLSAEVLDTVASSFEVAEAALVTVGDGVLDAEVAVRTVGESLADGEDALGAVADLADERLAGTVETIEGALTTVERAATVIDDTLATLGSLPIGPSYDPGRPLGTSIGQVRDALAGLSDQLREQADQIERTSAQLAAASDGIVGTADALVDLERELTTASELIVDYTDQTEQARVLVAAQQESLADSARRAQLLVVAFAVAFALGQFVPLYLGVSLLRGAPLWSGEGSTGAARVAPPPG